MFVSSYVKMRKFCSSDFVASLGYGLGLGRFLPLSVFSLSSPLVSRVIAFIYDAVRVRGVVSWASVPRSVVVTAKWVVSCTRITCIQPLSRCSLTVPLSFQKVFVCCCRCFVFSFLFRHTSLAFGPFVTAVSLPDQGSHFEFLFSSAFVYIPMLCHR